MDVFQPVTAKLRDARLMWWLASNPVLLEHPEGFLVLREHGNDMLVVWPFVQAHVRSPENDAWARRPTGRRFPKSTKDTPI